MTDQRALDRSKTDDDGTISGISDVGVDAISETRTADPAGATIPQLLATLLGPPALPFCRRLFAAHISLREIARLFPTDLGQYGCNRTHIEKLAALFELAKRFGEEEWLPGVVFRGSCDVYAHCRERLASEVVEHFYVVLLDNKNRKLKEVLVSKGSLTSSVVHPRDIYLPVIRESSAAVIFYHNHPSGDPTPSKEDLEITRRLRDVGEIIGVRVLDHIIIGKGRYVSMVDDGYW